MDEKDIGNLLDSEEFKNQTAEEVRKEAFSKGLPIAVIIEDWICYLYEDGRIDKRQRVRDDL